MRLAEALKPNLTDPAMTTSIETVLSRLPARSLSSTMTDMLSNFNEGQRHIAASDQTFFCSELVAHTFMLMGLLPFDPPANAYAPGFFSPEHGNLPFLRGASLGPLLQLVPPTAPAAGV
jgi:hypothetical protein